MIKDKKIYNEQRKKADDIIEKLNYNIVTCGNCGSINIVDLKKAWYNCYACGYVSDPCDFPDLFYDY
ncbi:MAG: hypothetical protein ACOC1K_05665 [Nanoarchaeota archaeon]